MVLYDLTVDPDFEAMGNHPNVAGVPGVDLHNLTQLSYEFLFSIHYLIHSMSTNTSSSSMSKFASRSVPLIYRLTHGFKYSLLGRGKCITLPTALEYLISFCLFAHDKIYA